MDLITYETIRAAHRAEKEEELQKLPDNFFQAVRNWFANKEKQKDTVSLLEIENAKKLLEDIINRRQRKIVLSALRTIRGELPPQNLNAKEQKFFDQIIDSLKSFKESMNEEFMSVEVVEEKIEEAKKALEEIKEPLVVKPEGKIVVKALTDIPRFVGSDMKAYGPLKTGDIITVPEEIGKILISRRVAENLLE